MIAHKKVKCNHYIMKYTKQIQAKHIPDDLIYQTIEEVKRDKQMGVASLLYIREKLTQYPAKVVLKKLENMVESKKLTGCACGCAGGFNRVVK